MQKIKLKDYLQMHLNKIFDIEVLEGDLVYFGKEIKAKNKDHALQIMHLKPLRESEFRHNAKNVRYGHRKCNIMMSDHDVEDTIKLMKDIVENHRKKNW